MPIGNVDRSVRAGLEIHRTEVRVRRSEHRTKFMRGIRGTFRTQLAQVDPALQNAGDKKPVAVGLGPVLGFTKGHGLGEFGMAAVVGHGVQIAERVGIGERAMLTPVLAVIATLHVMHPDHPTVAAGEQAPFTIHRNTEVVPTAFGKKSIGLFKAARRKHFSVN